jgi:hypothetical protein
MQVDSIRTSSRPVILAMMMMTTCLYTASAFAADASSKQHLADYRPQQTDSRASTETLTVHGQTYAKANGTGMHENGTKAGKTAQSELNSKAKRCLLSGGGSIIGMRVPNPPVECAGGNCNNGDDSVGGSTGIGSGSTTSGDPNTAGSSGEAAGPDGTAGTPSPTPTPAPAPAPSLGCAGASASGTANPSASSLIDCQCSARTLSSRLPEINQNPSGTATTSATLPLFYSGNIDVAAGSVWSKRNPQDTAWVAMTGDRRTGGTTASSTDGVTTTNGNWPGQAGNPVGYAAYGPLGTTPCSTTFTSGTAANPTVYKGCVYNGPVTISGSYIQFISCDFDSGSGGVDVSGSNITFIGSRFQSNSPGNYNVQTEGASLTFSYDSFTPLASLYRSPPGAAWPSAGAGQNTTQQTAGVNSIDGNSGYQYGISITSGGPVTVDHGDFWGFGNDAVAWLATTARMTITNNWMHDTANASPLGYHQDGIGYLNGGTGPSNILIQGNTIASLGNTNAIAFQAATGGYNNIQIIHNYVSGFGYTVAPGTPGNTRFTNSSFTDNVYGTDIEPVFGPLYGPPGSGTTWKCNKINVAPVTSWTINGLTPTAAMNGEYWVPTSAIVSATDYNGNTTCPRLR